MVPLFQLVLLLITLFICGLLTVASPLLGSALFLTGSFIFLCFRWPLFSFCFVAIVSFLNNVNIIYQSPLRIVAERYSLGIFLVMILALVVLLKIVIASSENFHGHAVSRHIVDTKASYDYLILFFCLWSAITMLWSADQYHGINALVNLFTGCCLYFLAQYFLNSSHNLELFFKVVFIGGVILVGVFMLSNIVDTINYSSNLFGDFSLEYGLITYGRRPGGFSPPQIAGNILIFIFFTGCILFVKARPALKNIIILLSFLFCSAIFASGSKAAAGSFIISVFFFIIIFPPLRKKAIWHMPATFMIFIFVLIFNALVLGRDRISSGEDMNNLSLSLRLEFWAVGFDMLRQQVMGTGIGGFARLVDPWPGAHSFYFSILFDTGIIGCLILLAYLIGIIFKIHFLWHKDIDDNLRFYLQCMLTFWIAFFVHATVDLAFFLPHIWLFLGVLSALLKISESSTVSFTSNSCGKIFP